MFKKLKQIASRNLVNIPGWRSDRKIVVFESDDWGSIRMPSKEVYKKMLEHGIPVDKSPYCKYDSLASEDDLAILFDALTQFRDSSGRCPIITANTVVANPDFEKIEASNFEEYYYEVFTETLKRYSNHSNSFNLWKDGMNTGIFHPQFHGREHLNVQLWLDLLQEGQPDFIFAFKNECFGLSRDVFPEMKLSIQAALDTEESQEINFHKRSLAEGCNIFEKTFGYKAKSFIANNFIWDSSVHSTLSKAGIIYLQGMKYQKKPLLRKTSRAMVRHYLGEKNEFGQYYLIRNCAFEPSQESFNFDNVGECLRQISNAFLWNKPAIISSHRLNYIGHLDPQNRTRNIGMFRQLLKNIIKKWPEVEFMTSDELGTIIELDTENAIQGV